jgi:ribonucleoside-triphosphate reductase (thioredoxin)
MLVQKRDGSTQAWDIKKIRAALLRVDEELPTCGIADQVEKMLPTLANEEAIVGVDEIGDALEQVLMNSGFESIAKEMIIYREDRRRARVRRSGGKNDQLSAYIHATKYAREKGDGQREGYSQTVERVFDMHMTRFWGLLNPNDDQYDMAFEKMFNEAKQAVLDKKILPSMRSMQFGGPAIEQDHARLYNCSFTLVDRVRVFQEAFYLLLMGCGVGFSVQEEHVQQLPQIEEPDEGKVIHHTVEDSCKGWADALGMLVGSYFTGTEYVEFSYHLIRAEGEPLKTSGGLAPGHLPLKRMLDTVRNLLQGQIGHNLRPIHCHDIMCHIAEAVLSGGIRRSSLISLFSPSDTEMLHAKDPREFSYPVGMWEGKNPHRAMANNSAVLVRGETAEDVFEKILSLAATGYGEPGFLFTQDKDYGTNPCGEIGLEPRYTYPDGRQETGWSFCNLCEINGSTVLDRANFIHRCEVASFIGTLQATYSDMPYLGVTTAKIHERDRLLGVGITGVMDNPGVCLDSMTLLRGAEKVRAVNKLVSQMLGINTAARCTTIKPSGTASLELGCVSSGIHPQHSRRYFRRVTANRNEQALKVMQEKNPHAVEKKPNGDYSIVFPVEAPDKAVTRKEISGKEMVWNVVDMFRYWVMPGRERGLLNHNVSCTVTVGVDEDISDIMKLVWNQQGSLAAMSFAPMMLDKGVPFIPLETVTPEDEGRWAKLVSSWVDIDFSILSGSADVKAVAACEGDKCMIDFSSMG